MWGGEGRGGETDQDQPHTKVSGYLSRYLTFQQDWVTRLELFSWKAAFFESRREAKIRAREQARFNFILSEIIKP